MKNDMIIVFTREPEPGLTKTRMMPALSGQECGELHAAFIRDIAEQCRQCDADIMVDYSSSDGSCSRLRRIFGDAAGYMIQQGESLGIRMLNGIRAAKSAGYDRVVLIGTDIPELRSEILEKSLMLLDRADVVLGPTADGGYYLAAMRRAYEAVFDLKEYGTDTVLGSTVSSCRTAGLSCLLTDSLNDIDTIEDLRELASRNSKGGGVCGRTMEYIVGTEIISA